MRQNVIISILLVVLAISAAIFLRVSVARGGAFPMPRSRASAAGIDAGGVAYQGHLTGVNGEALVDGLYAFRFALYENQADEVAIWTEEHRQVQVRGGDFFVQLGSLRPLPDQAIRSGQLYLRTAVRGPGEPDFTTLNPPQVLRAVQTSSSIEAPLDMACPHDHVGETWTQAAYANGLKIKNTGGGTSLVAESNTNFWSAIEGNNSGSAIGVYGYSQSGAGVLGDSGSGYGGVFDSGNDSLDLQLRGNVGRINANEFDDSMLYLSSNGDIYNKLDNDGGESQYFKIANSNDAVVFSVDESGNVWKYGTISSVVKTPEYGGRTLYALESPETWIEDFGQASLLDGEAQVRLDPVFAETVNLEAGYHVFLTPICQQPVVLFVASKNSTGFTVRGVTLEGEPANCDFDYRLAAKRMGFETLRLEEADPALQEAHR
jgi:hypothetical protein